MSVFVGQSECKVTQSSTDTEVLCSPPTLAQLQADAEQRQYEINLEENNTDRKRKRELSLQVKKRRSLYEKLGNKCTFCMPFRNFWKFKFS